MAKNKNDKKPRTYSVTLDMGKPVSANGFIYDPKTGRAALLNNGQVLNPENATVEQSYERKKGPKVLNRVVTKPTHLFANPNRVLEQYDTIYAVDTNTRVINSVSTSVTGVVGGENTKTIIPGNTSIIFRPIKCFEFRNVSCKAENLGWRELIKAIVRAPTYNNRTRIAIVVDSDLGMIDSYNRREVAIIDDFIIPSNFSLVYASADSGNENIANKMLKLADNISSVVLNGLESDRKEDNLSVITGGHYTHFRVWEPSI